MVDVTFPFIILLGGMLAGLVTAQVRGHRGGRKAADILVAAICGPLATTAWMSIVPRLVEREPDGPYMSREWAFLLSDLLWFSPVIGGFIGVLAVAVGYRIAGHGPHCPNESWGEMLGAGIRIVGWVYAVIATLLVVGIIILAISFGETDFITMALLPDLFKGPALVLLGWLLARLSRTPDAQPAPPPPS